MKNIKKILKVKLVNFSKYFILSIILIASLSTCCFSQNVEDVLFFIRSPQDLASWFSREFKRQPEATDYWQQPEEMLNSKKGDCEDFAILASAILRRLGYKPNILVIKFKKTPTAHAICIFKDKGGFYRIISNQQLFSTGKKSLDEAVSKFYPNWERLTFATAKKKCINIMLSARK